MDSETYKNRLAKRLIQEFQHNFYEKIGYVPLIYNLKEMNEKIIRLDLLELIINKHIPQKIITRHKITSIKHNSRIWPLYDLRHIFCHIARSMGYTLTVIGDYLNGRDHTTVMNSLKKFKELIITSPTFSDDYKQIQDDINEYFKDDGNKLLQFAIENPINS